VTSAGTTLASLSRLIAGASPAGSWTGKSHVLHAGGIAFGFVIGRIAGRHVFRVGGALVALAGVAILVSPV
jgi:hypothetical protein